MAASKKIHIGSSTAPDERANPADYTPAKK
jgi:hypothetical protein